MKIVRYFLIAIFALPIFVANAQSIPIDEPTPCANKCRQDANVCISRCGDPTSFCARNCFDTYFKCKKSCK